QPAIADDEEFFVRSMLTWLTRWAAYPSPYLARLFENAATLTRLLPFTRDASRIVYSIPRHSPEIALNLARSTMEVAAQYELDKNFHDVHTNLNQVIGEIVSAWIERDEADSGAVDEEIAKVKDLVTEAKKAVQTA